MKKIIVDSCVWIAYYLKKDKFHKKAEYFLSWLEDQEDIKIIINEYILSETLTFLRRKVRSSLKNLKKVMDFFLNDERIDLFYTNPDLFNEALKIFEKYDKFSITDSIIFLLYFNLKPNYLLTYDDDFFSFENMGLIALKDPV